MSKNLIKGFLFSFLLVMLVPNLAHAEIDISYEIEKRKAEIEAVMIENFGNIDNVDKALEDLGVEIIETETEVQYSPLSLGSNVTVSSSYYRDRFSGRYFVRGAWNWNCTTTCYDLTNASPNDAFGVWLNNTSDGKPASGQVFESSGSAIYDTDGAHQPAYMWSSDFDPANAGAAWEIKDGYWLNSLNSYVGHSGQAWIWMSKPPTGDVYLRAKLIHTWSSGTISNIGIGPSGLTATLGTSTKNWQKMNDITKISTWPSN